MGEILGLSNLSGSLVCMQTKDQVPYAVAHKLFVKLIQTVSPLSTQQIIENFRAQYLIINEVIFFVFSTLTENPFISLDSLYKLRDFIMQISRDLKIENVLKKNLDVNYGIEDILNNNDPVARINPKVPVFTLSRPFQSFYSSSSSLVYLNKSWKNEGSYSAYREAVTDVAVEKDLIKLTMSLPKVYQRPAPLVHPFLIQFMESPSAVQVKESAAAAKRITENTSINISLENTSSKEYCKLVIMEKTFVSFKNTTITNLRVVGQFGIELYSRCDEKGTIKIGNLDWSDSKKIGKRLNEEFITEIDDFTYEVAINKMKETSKIIEYIVSPNIIDIKNLPIFAMFNCEKVENTWTVQIKYQVSANWKNPLEDVHFAVFLNKSEFEIVESNIKAELVGNCLQWRAQKLFSSQKGLLEALVKGSDCRIENTKIQFRSNNSLLSTVSAMLSYGSVTTGATLKYLSEVVISSDN